MKTHRWSFRVLSFLSLLLGMALPAAAPAAPVEKASADAPLVADKIREAMQDRRYADAVKAIDEAAQVKDAPRDYLLYLKGRALHLDGKYDEAIAVFDQLGKELPKSPWARRARFAKAVSLARKGDFRSAELIYRAEAEYLLSTDRKQQIADIYLEFADTYFKPPKEEQKPDYAKALEFYKKALETGAKAGEADRDRAAHRPVPAEPRQAGRGGRALRAVHQGPSRQPLGYRSPLPARARAAWRKATPARPGGSGRICWPSMSIRSRRAWPTPSSICRGRGTSPTRATTSN